MIVFILSVTNGVGITWGTEALINVYIFFAFTLSVSKVAKFTGLTRMVRITLLLNI